MEKKYSVQKKKTPLIVFFNILFKVLVAIAIIIFAYIAFTKVNFSTNSFDFNSKKQNKREANVPSELKWFDDFKGIENVPDKKAKKNSNNSGSSNSGFSYQGFKK